MPHSTTRSNFCRISSANAANALTCCAIILPTLSQPSRSLISGVAGSAFQTVGSRLQIRLGTSASSSSASRCATAWSNARSSAEWRGGAAATSVLRFAAITPTSVSKEWATFSIPSASSTRATSPKSIAAPPPCGETPASSPSDPTPGEPPDRCDPFYRLPGFAPRFEGPPIRLGYLPVVLEREQPRDIDVDAVGQETLDRRPSLPRPGHLDHHVRTVDRGPQSPGLSDRARGVPREGRRHFERDESIGPLGRVIDRAKGIRGGAHVFHGQEFEDLSIGSGRRGDPRERSVVIGAAADRVLEDRRVGRHATQPVVDHPLELAGLQHAASEVVEPDALPEVEQNLHARFHGSLAATAAAPSSATCGLTITCSGTRARYPDIRPLSRKARRNAPLRRCATIRGAMPPPT